MTITRKIILVSAVLLLSFGLRTWVSASPVIPTRSSLSEFPKDLDGWKLVGEDVLSDPIAGVLKADDYIMRNYQNAKGRPVDMFVAYYRTQRAGESMHSPRNCLPGWGWQILQTDQIALTDQSGKTEMVNRYLVEKDGQRALVLYWYQANGRVIASEYWGKIYLVLDALRSGRRDGAIVRFVVGIPRGEDPSISLKAATDMAGTVMPLLPKYLPD
jgi:EpsI family protein